MRFRLFCLTVACALGDDPVLAAVRLRRAADAGRLPGRSEPPLARRPLERVRPRRGGARRHRPDDRLLVADRARRGPANGANPFDPAYRFDDLDEFVRNAGLHGMEVMLTIWGTPPWANGGQGPELRADAARGPAELRARAGRALLGPLPGLSVRPLLHGLERVEPRPVPLAAVRLEAASRRRRRSTRGSYRAGVRGHQGR